MQFKISPTRFYTVRRKWELACDGERCDGLCAYSTRTLWLDADLAPEIAESTLRHELVHAYESELGAPHTEEDRANFTSTVSEAFEYEFEQQGGRDALAEIPIEGLRPTTRKTPPAMNSRNMADRIECGRCGTQIMVGSIFTGPAELVDSVGFHMVARGCQCPVCDAVQTWRERSTEAGLPLGEFYGAKLLTGAEAEAWAAEHRELHCPYNAA